MINRIRARTYKLMEAAESDDLSSRIVDGALVALILLNVVAVVLESMASMGGPYQGYFAAFEMASVAIFTAEYLTRIWSAVEMPAGRYRHPVLGRLRYMITPMAVIDLVAIGPFYLGVLLGIDLRFLRVLRLLRLLKLTRYSGAWDTLAAVIIGQKRTLAVAAFLMLIMLMLSASVMYLVEHDAQPVAFADIPSAIWWALVTLTTVGYGDVTPITSLGKVLGGFVTILGLGMYALPAGILASGFVQEFNKRQFVVTWNLVARVPFFAKLDAEEIAKIAGLLTPITVPARHTIIRRGEVGDCMYFISSGDVEVDIPPHPFHLSTGEFFGEVAVLSRKPRVATVISITECKLLQLEARDLDRLLDDHPEMADEFKRIARDRIAETSEHFDAHHLPDWLSEEDLENVRATKASSGE